MARYPEIHVSVRSPNPLALVAAVRQGLRRAGVEKQEIERFSVEAFESDDPGHVRRVCHQWVDAVSKA